MAGVFTVVMLASIGVPGLNGFVSEFLVLSGTFLTHRWWAVVAVLGVIVAAIYLLWAYQQVFHGEPREADEKTRDLVLLERLVMAPLIILIVFLGVYPKPVLDRINPSVNQLIAHVESTTGHAAAVGGGQGRGGRQVIARPPAPRARDARGVGHHRRAADPLAGHPAAHHHDRRRRAAARRWRSLVRRPLRVRSRTVATVVISGGALSASPCGSGPTCRQPRSAHLRESGRRHGRLQRPHHHARLHRHAAQRARGRRLPAAGRHPGRRVPRAGDGVGLGRHVDGRWPTT